LELDPKAVDRIVRRHLRKTGIAGRYTAHSMRAKLISTALDSERTEMTGRAL
jgi:hypothetical protein